MDGGRKRAGSISEEEGLRGLRVEMRARGRMERRRRRGLTKERNPLFVDLGTGAGVSSSSSSESAGLGASFLMGSSKVLRCFLAGGRSPSSPPPAPPPTASFAAGRDPSSPPVATCFGAAAAFPSSLPEPSPSLPYPARRSISPSQRDSFLPENFPLDPPSRSCHRLDR